MTRDGHERRDARSWSVVITVSGSPDLGTIDLLARLRLTASRTGGKVRVIAEDPRLDELLELAGLRSVVECERQPEPGEEVDVEEVVNVGDSAVGDLEHLD